VTAPHQVAQGGRGLASGAVLDPLVEVLAVHPHHHQVEPGGRTGDAGEAATRPDPGVQAKRAAEGEAHRAGGARAGGARRALQGDAAVADRVQGRLRKGCAGALQALLAGGDQDPLDRRPGGVECAASGLGHLRPYAIARDQGHAMGHGIWRGEWTR
jgi:hypothetical protein